MDGFDFAARLAALRARFERARVDGMLVSHLPNVRYLCGFSGSNGLLLVTPRGARLYTDGRYREQAARETQGVAVEIPPHGDIWRAAARRAASLAALALEPDRVTLATHARLRALWKPGRPRLRLVAGWVEAQRAVKDPLEIASLRRAVNLASSVFDSFVAELRPGMPETEVAGRLEFALRRVGGEGLAFDTIVASGARAALVHAHPTAARLVRRGFLVLDYGVILGGYVSDMTRTVHLGRPSPRARSVYRAVLDAQQAAIAAIRPGVAAAAVDAAARRVLERAGMGPAFSHSTGHGVGLEIHEAPRLARTSRDRLAAGHVVTVEPGAYFADWGGVRIEDVVLVTARGAEVLTPTCHELLSL